MYRNHEEIREPGYPLAPIGTETISNILSMALENELARFPTRVPRTADEGL
jgi:hypothetical protein